VEDKLKKIFGFFVNRVPGKFERGSDLALLECF